jgi:hypothetical protein
VRSVLAKPESEVLADLRRPLSTSVSRTDDQLIVNDVLVVRRADLRLSGPPIADSGRVGLGTLFNNDYAAFCGHGGSDLRSLSNMRSNSIRDRSPKSGLA